MHMFGFIVVVELVYGFIVVVELVYGFTVVVVELVYGEA